MKILIPLGTRPEIVKLAPVVLALQAHGHEVRTVATGQHYDAALTDSFFEELGFYPDVRWELPDGESARLGAILANAVDEVGAIEPDLVIVLGDTYTVPLFSLAARRHRVPLAHVEAGLRSFNETSMEETNRKVAAIAARLHFAPTELAARFLRDEGIDPARIRVVGNPVIDVLVKKGVAARPVHERHGVLLTAHRPTNVDDPVRLENLVTLIERLADELGSVTFPVHPRTRGRLEAAGLLGRLDREGVELLEPIAYEDMLDRLSRCRVVVTDSGGLQEEAAYLRVPAVVLRKSTPRWEGIELDIAALSGLEVERVMTLVERFASTEEQERIAQVPCPYGDGTTAEQIAAILAEPSTPSLLAITEPDLIGWRP